MSDRRLDQMLPAATMMLRGEAGILVRACFLAFFLCSAQFPAAAWAQSNYELDTIGVARLDTVLDESSGLAIHNGSIWTHNDSGDEARLFELDRLGNIKRQVVISNADNIDWEAMASDADYLYIADTGNNVNFRSTLSIYRLSWDSLQAATAEAEQIQLRYADHVAGNPRRHNFDFRSTLSIYRLSWDSLQAATAEAEQIQLRYADHVAGNPRRHNFDAEAIAVRGDELWLFSKNRGDRNTRLYRFPKVPGYYRPQPSQTLPVDSLVTGADIHPQSGDLILLSSRRQGENFVWWAPTSDSGVNWQQLQLVRIEPADQWEAIHWDPDNSRRIYLTHERNTRNFAGLATIELRPPD